MNKCLKFATMFFALSLCAAPLWAQITGTITGVAKDKAGNPISGATVELVNTQSGTKYQLKTNAKGQYYSVGISLGVYHATLVKDGQELDQHGNVVIEASGERQCDFDLAQDTAAAAQQQQKAAAQQSQNQKIKGLNDTLKQAKELEGAGNYDQAVTILQQATQVDPTQDLVWAYLGDAQRGAKKYSDAVESYQKALAIKPTSGPYMAQLADAYANRGNHHAFLTLDSVDLITEIPDALTHLLDLLFRRVEFHRDDHRSISSEIKNPLFRVGRFY